MGRITEIVDRAISIADLAKTRDSENARHAYEALRKLADELMVNEHTHPALKKLEEYLQKNAQQ